MPLYDYVCPKCGTVDEHIVRNTDLGEPTEPVFNCSKCESPTVRTVGGGNTSFIFNGKPFSASTQK